MSQKKEILGQIGVYSSSWFFSQLITIVGSVLTRLFLGPLQMGVWSILQVVLSYSKFTTFGVGKAALREIPYQVGQGQTDKVDDIKNAVFTFGLLTAVIVSIGLIGYAVVGRDHLRPEVFLGLLFLAGLIILNRINNLLIVFLRATKRFSLAGKQMMFSSVLNVICVGFLSYHYKIYGFMVAMALSLIFNIVYILWQAPLKLHLKVNVPLIKQLIAYGSPLLVLTLTSTLFITIDKIMIASFLGLEALGWYSIAIMAANTITNLSNSVGTVLNTNLNERYGKTNDIQSLKGFVSKSAHAFSTGMPLIILGAWFGVPYLVRLVLPEYVQGIGALKLLLLGTFFLALSHPYNQFLISIKKHLTMLPVTAGACLIALSLNFAAVKLGLGIVGIAGATVTAILFRFSGIYFIAAKHLYSRGEAWKNYLVFMATFVCMVAVMGLLQGLTLGLQLLVFVLICVPIVYKFNKEYEIWDTVLASRTK